MNSQQLQIHFKQDEEEDDDEEEEDPSKFDGRIAAVCRRVWRHVEDESMTSHRGNRSECEVAVPSEWSHRHWGGAVTSSATGLFLDFVDCLVLSTAKFRLQNRALKFYGIFRRRWNRWNREVWVEAAVIAFSPLELFAPWRKLSWRSLNWSWRKRNESDEEKLVRIISVRNFNFFHFQFFSALKVLFRHNKVKVAKFKCSTTNQSSSRNL